MILQLLLFLLSSWPIKIMSQQAEPNFTKPQCQSSCGNVTIPFPFGIGEDCYLNDWYAVDCRSGKPFVRSINLELFDISLLGNTMRVNQPVLSSCQDHEAAAVKFTALSTVNLEKTPFFFSYTSNRFTGVGCDNFATISSSSPSSTSFLGGCFSNCNDRITTIQQKDCNGVQCCQARIPQFLRSSLNISVSSMNSETTSSCKHAFLVEQQWFDDNFASPEDVQSWKQVPVILDWMVFNSSLELPSGNATHPEYRCKTHRFDEIFLRCECSDGYEGNPYLRHGCQDINECAHGICGRTMFCENYAGGYNCYHRKEWGLEKRARSKVFMLIIGPSSSLGGLFLLLGVWWLGIKLGKRIYHKEKNFRRNGGLLLQKQLKSLGDGIERCKIFTSNELDNATDHFNINRILGQGGQGTVYKGMMADGRIIAVKKFKVVDERKLEEFINEVVILSQINHRNVVKLLGCCLETEFPLLVYEFIPNGTLFQYLYNQNEELPMTWDMRLRIASDVAEALSYLHSAAYLPIYHRDIKSTNILLDEKYRARLADFGISRSIEIDQTHVSTKVQGTFGYFDPEYFRSSQFTDKSDVYSFGVVLVEILTGQKPISSTWAEEGINLASYFVKSMEEKNLYDILDAQAANPENIEEILAIANVAKRCLNPIGKSRPTMKEVAMELERIRASQDGNNMKQDSEDIESVTIEVTEPWDIISTSSTGSTSENVTFSMDIKQLTSDI